MVVAEDRDEVGLDDSDLSEASPEGVTVIVTTKETDQVLDTFEAVVVLQVPGPVEGAQGRAGGLQLHVPVHPRGVRVRNPKLIIVSSQSILYFKVQDKNRERSKIPRITKNKGCVEIGVSSSPT